jgi:hypothetical protein
VEEKGKLHSVHIHGDGALPPVNIQRSRSRVAANEPLDEEELLRSRHLQWVENNGRQIELICCNW